MVFICISLMLSNVELLSSTCCPSVCLIRKKKNVQSERLPIFSIRLFLFCFFVIGSSEFFIYFNINPYHVYDLQVFSPNQQAAFSFCLPFTLLCGSFFLFAIPCGLWDLKSWTRDSTQVPSCESTESHSMDHQGIPAFWFDTVPLYFSPLCLVSFFFFFFKHQDQC